MIRLIPCTLKPSARLLRACALFGLGITTKRRTRDEALHAAAARICAMSPACIAVLAGPSGCGKSTLLLRVERELRRAGIVPLIVRERVWPRRVVIDLVPGPIDTALRTLAAAGLADAAVLARTPRELSEGERFRLRLALAMAKRPAWMLIDEFASTLDEVTARTVCELLRRYAARTGARIVVATPRARVAADLRGLALMAEGPRMNAEGYGSEGGGGAGGERREEI